MGHGDVVSFDWRARSASKTQTQHQVQVHVPSVPAQNVLILTQLDIQAGGTIASSLPAALHAPRAAEDLQQVQVSLSWRELGHPGSDDEEDSRYTHP